MFDPRGRAAAAIAFTAVGLAASAALLVDYTTFAPVFCSEGGGCDALRQTAFAHPFGFPLPALGLLGFLLQGTLVLTRGKWVRRVNAVVAGVGGVIGLGLVALQVLFGHFCPYCTVVDVSQLFLAVLAWNRLREAWDPAKGPLASFVGSLSLGVAMAAPFLWAQYQERKLPDVIAAELARTPPGTATIVDFVDFECPFCRMTQANLEPALRAHAGHVRMVRKLVPLTRIHHHALAAAKAACCAEALGKGDEMADTLFTTKIEDLTPDGCKALAQQLGLPLAQYDACIASPDTDARLEKDRRDFVSVRGGGLPLMWIGTRKLMGAQPEATLESAVDEALARAGS